MCGIAGSLEAPGARPGHAELQERAGRMASRIAHRGPDGEGIWVDEAPGVALAHRRLAILDLSPLGAQPMHSRGGRYVVTYNGEIYNFGELRKELLATGHSFRGRSDTEVLLAAVEEWGVEKALRAFDGMFAIGLWDREKRELWLARDRLGEKPLYYGWSGGTFLFGSELKALCAHPAWRGRIDRGALSLYFRFNCIPAPYCIYEGIQKLPAGSLLRLPADAAPGELPEARPFWRLEEVAAEARSRLFEGDEEEAVSELGCLFERAVSRRMISDVPLGAFLSGGIDSSLVVAMMQKSARQPVRTFTIGFTEQDYDEAAQARKIASHLGTEHSECRLTPTEAMDVVPGLPRDYDEPFSDSSQIATLLVARHARKKVSVCLSGDAGDELFAGYHRHFLGNRIWKTMRGVPGFIRGGAASALRGVPAPVWARVGGLMGRPPQIFADQARKLIDILPARGPRELYLTLVSHARDPESIVLSSREPSTLPTQATWLELGSAVADFQYLDSMTYLPDDILTKVDRATMAVGLEARVPFLDPEIIRFAWRLPDSFKVRDGQGKWILRQLLARHLPPELISRPKSGFAVPIGAWLRGPLKDWASQLLSDQKIRTQGYLDPGQVSRLWAEHQSGNRNRQDELWDILMFQSWLAETTESFSA